MERVVTIIFISFISILSTQAFALGRDQTMLNNAIRDSNRERAGAEKSYRAEGRNKRAADRNQVRAIRVEIGDELGAEGDSADLRQDSAPYLEESGVSKKLENEWQEVNRSRKGSENTRAKNRPARKISSGR